MSEPREAAVELVRRVAGVCVLALSGELSQRSVQPVTAAVSKALADTGCILVDVSGLRLSWPPAVRVFPAVLEDMGGWPGTQLVISGAHAG